MTSEEFIAYMDGKMSLAARLELVTRLHRIHQASLAAIRALRAEVGSDEGCRTVMGDAYDKWAEALDVEVSPASWEEIS